MSDDSHSTLISAAYIAPMAEPGGNQAPGAEGAPAAAPAADEEKEKTVLEDHAVVVQGPRIAALLPAAEARQRFPDAEAVHLPRHLLIPGLINAHGHSPMSLLRGVADDIPLKTWLERRIWPLEQHFVSEEFCHDGSLLSCAEMIRSGTTAFADMYFFPEQTAAAATKAGLRLQLASPVLDFPTVWARDADEYLRRATELHDDMRGNPLVTTAFGPHAPYTVSDGPLREIATLAEELDMRVHIHLHETAAEVADAVAADGRRPLARLHDLGLVSPHLVCVHATQLQAREMELLAKYGAAVVHCPQSNLKLASGFCETAKLLEHGVVTALGSDGCASNNDLDMLDEMRTAALLGKGVAGDAAALSAYQVLEMATLSGAKALGLEDDIGSIEAGKYADLTAVDLEALNSMPMYDPLSHLVYCCKAGQVSHVWCGGRLLLQDGELQTLDPALIKEKALQWQERIKTHAKSLPP